MKKKNQKKNKTNIINLFIGMVGIIFFIPTFSMAELDPNINLVNVCENSENLEQKEKEL